MIIFENTKADSQKLMRRIYKAALRHFGQRDIFLLEICVVSAEEIQAINLERRGVDAVTDVLSFPAIEIEKLPIKKVDYPNDIDLDCNRLILGEIAICYERLLEQATEYGHSEQREAAYLTLHGILHLLGFDHVEESDKTVMRAHEEAILNKLGIVRE